MKELTPPVISLALPSQGLKVVRNTDYTFTPDIQHSDVEGFKIEWVREGKSFPPRILILSMKRTRCLYGDNQRFQYRWDNNERRKRRGRGNDALRCQIPDPVLPANIHGQVHFCRPSCFPASVVGVFRQSPFEWSVDGQVMEGEVERMFKFTPSAPGEYTVSCTVSEDTPTEK